MHDFYVDSYVVNIKEKKLILNLSYEKQKKKVCFTEVLTHHFDVILQDNQILDIEERTIDNFLKYEKKMIMDLQPYLWPLPYGTLQELRQILLENQYKYIIIYSSYGLSGWVLAKEMQVIDGE